MTPTKVAPIEIEHITAEQIGRVADRFSEKCRKNKSSLSKDVVQLVLEDEGDALAQEMFEAVRSRVERRREMVVRHFKIDPTLTPAQMIKVLGHKEYVDGDVLATMPKHGADEGDFYLFPIKRDLPVTEYAAMLESHGLVPHPRAQIQVNIDDLSLGDEHPNGVQWQDADGKFCCAVFDRWHDERGVGVHRYDSRWSSNWWLGGVRKPATV